jgi:hypothetical protein
MFEMRTPSRPGISAATLAAAGVQIVDYPEAGAIIIPYHTPEGDMTRFARWRLPKERANGQKYHQERGTGTGVYFPPAFYHRNGNVFGIPSGAVILVEGEFKALSLLEQGAYAIGLPSFVVYSNDENGNPRLLRDLQVMFSKEQPRLIYFLGDADTAANFEFSRQAAFLASAAYPAQVFLPRIPINQPKGVDDRKEALGEEFGAFFEELIRTAIPLDRKSDPTAVALILFEREADHVKALTGTDRERQFNRIVHMVGAAQRSGETSATARLRTLAAKVMGLTPAELKAAIQTEDSRRKNDDTLSRRQKKESAASTGLDKTKVVPETRPDLILPGHKTEINECGRNCFAVLAKTNLFFMRDRTVFELVTDKDDTKLAHMDPVAFCSRLEDHFVLWEMVSLNRRIEMVKRRCSIEDAKKLLKCTPAHELLLPIQLVTAAPVFIEQDSTVKILPRGYHATQGGIYVTRDYAIKEMHLTEAAEMIKSLSNDYRFVSESDRSRFTAGFLAPALRQGGLIAGDFPLLVHEADQPQSGKTYTHRVLCGIYNEAPAVITFSEDKRSINSPEEQLSKGMIEGRSFILFENTRGPINSQLTESAICGAGRVTCRIAYMAPIEVKTDKITWLLSSNKASTTPDLAARSLITQMRKQPTGHAYRTYEDGRGLLEETRHNPDYLSAILAIVKEWVAKGKPRTNDARHDFREVCQSLDWIVQNILGMQPLLDGHQKEQARAANPLLNWLRDVAILVQQENKLGKWMRAHEISEICANHELSIPQCRPDADDNARLIALGRLFSRLFKSEQVLSSVGGFTLARKTEPTYVPDFRQYRQILYYNFATVQA